MSENALVRKPVGVHLAFGLRGEDHSLGQDKSLYPNERICHLLSRKEVADLDVGAWQREGGDGGLAPEHLDRPIAPAK